MLSFKSWQAVSQVYIIVGILNETHLPPSSAKINNEWGYTSIPLYAFKAWTGKPVTFV
jgi:hypothetical protein